MLNRTAKPKRAAAPIQSQFLSVNTSKFFSTSTPNLVTLSEAYNSIMKTNLLLLFITFANLS